MERERGGLRRKSVSEQDNGGGPAAPAVVAVAVAVTSQQQAPRRVPVQPGELRQELAALAAKEEARRLEEESRNAAAAAALARRVLQEEQAQAAAERARQAEDARLAVKLAGPKPHAHDGDILASLSKMRRHKQRQRMLSMFAAPPSTATAAAAVRRGSGSGSGSGSGGSGGIGAATGSGSGARPDLQNKTKTNGIMGLLQRSESEVAAAKRMRVTPPRTTPCAAEADSQVGVVVDLASDDSNSGFEGDVAIAAAAPPTQRSCAACTFLNVAAATTCEVCGSALKGE